MPSAMHRQGSASKADHQRQGQTGAARNEAVGISNLAGSVMWVEGGRGVNHYEKSEIMGWLKFFLNFNRYE